MISKQDGFSLVEVLITSAIMGVVGLILAGFMTDLMKQYRGIDSKSQLVDVVSEIRTELSSEAACFNSFGGLNPTTGFNITQLKDRSGANSATKVPLTYGGINRNLFVLTGMRVQDFNDSVTGVGDRVGSANLVLTFDIGQNGVSTSINRSIRLHAEVDAAGGIVRCLALSGMTDGIWQKISSSSQHIFYSTGNVGIGTDNPQGSLHVASGRIVQQSGDFLTNPAVGRTTLGTSSRFLNFDYNHASGFAAISGAAPAGSAIGMPSGAVALNGSAVLLMNPTNAGRTQIIQDAVGFKLRNDSGNLNFETPGSMSFEPYAGPFIVGSAARPASAQVISNLPNLLTLQRLGAGNLNSTIQFLNGSNKTLYAGMASDETFGVGPNPNLSTSDTWFEVNRTRGAQIRSFDPSVLMLTRTATGLNTALRYYNGNYNLFLGMTVDGDFAVDTDENLTTSPLLRYDRATTTLEIGGKAKASQFVESSDLRLKKDVQPLQDPLENILKLRGVDFAWRKPQNSHPREMGLIAQEVQEVYPDSVFADKSGFLSVRYTSLIAPLIESVKALVQKNQNQDLKISELENQIKILQEAIHRCQPVKDDPLRD